jgi:hypothetical protein
MIREYISNQGRGNEHDDEFRIINH